MFFIDLDKLEIKESNNCSIVSEKIEVDVDDATTIIASKARDICDKLLNKNKWNKPVVFNIIIDSEPMEKEDFITIVNVFNAVFFEKIIVYKGRKRERRLDIPKNFFPVHISAGLLKKAINYQTKVDKFNLTIRYNDLCYYMIDEKGE